MRQTEQRIAKTRIIRKEALERQYVDVGPGIRQRRREVPEDFAARAG